MGLDVALYTTIKNAIRDGIREAGGLPGLNTEQPAGINSADVNTDTFADLSWTRIFRVERNTPILIATKDPEYPVMQSTGEILPAGILLQTEYKRHAKDVDGQGIYHRIVGVPGNLVWGGVEFNERHNKKAAMWPMAGYFIDQSHLHQLSERQE